MTDLKIQCFNLDSTDPQRAAGFWEQALGWRRTHDTSDEVVLEPPAGSPLDGVAPDLLFLRVPEGKEVKNRWHPDLRPRDQAAEVTRLEALGASRVDLGQRPDQTFVVMADPDGNEFCVLRASQPGRAGPLGRRSCGQLRVRTGVVAALCGASNGWSRVDGHRCAVRLRSQQPGEHRGRSGRRDAVLRGTASAPSPQVLLEKRLLCPTTPKPRCW